MFKADIPEKSMGKEPVPLRIRENDFINKEEDIAVYIHVPYINDGLPFS